MSEVPLKALAEECGLPHWPIRGKSEIASKYIDYTWQELHELLGLADKPERIDLLIDILKETIAFEDPFGEMVDTVDAADEREDTLGKAFRKMEIDPSFPLGLSGLSLETIEFCKAEDIETIGQFAEFSNNMAQNVIVGGDFKELLNALSNMDERNVARFLPFRPTHKGFHLPEAIGMVLNQLAENEKFTLLKRYGAKLGMVENAKASLNKDMANQLEEVLMQKVSEQCNFFEKQIPEIESKLKSGATLERIFMVLDNPEKELIAGKVMGMYLKQRRGSSYGQEVEAPRNRGLFGRLFGR
ncbi:MAG: hypothetical protein AAGF10_01010 [Verrucomicrobiota bacterium]